MKTIFRPLSGGALRGFTLVEMLVSATITVLIAGILFAVLSQTSRVVGRTAGKVEEFREARNAFDAVTARLAQATLNTYIDYDSSTSPTKYLRRSELRFISGPAIQVLGANPAGKARSTDAVFFQAPIGLTGSLARYASFENLLCTCGYYLEVATDQTARPKFMTEDMVPLRYRPRLMEFSQPTEMNGLYYRTNGAQSRTYNGKDWYTTFVPLSNAPVHQLAENIVAFIVTPRLAPADEVDLKGGAAAALDPDTSPLAPLYLYDSAPQPIPPDTRYKNGRTNPTNQLPPMLQVTLVAVDEPGAKKLGYDKSNLDPLGLDLKFKNTTNFSKDLLRTGSTDSVENKLIAARVNYRIFTTNVIIRGAKWSREQTN